MFVKDTEEIGAGGALAHVLGVVILEEGEEISSPTCLAQIFEEARTRQIDLVPIRALTAAIVDGVST